MPLTDAIRKFNAQLIQIAPIITQSCAIIGYAKNSNGEDDVTILAPDSNIENNPLVKQPHAYSPFNYYEDSTDYPKDIPKIIGFNQYHDNSNLFLSASPITINPDAPKRYLYEMLSTITALKASRTMHTPKIIVLGTPRSQGQIPGNLTAYVSGVDTSDKEGAYITKLKAKPRDENRRMVEYQFKVTHAETALEAKVFFINADSNQFDLTLTDLEHLHALMDLHKNAAKTGEYYPIVVHCTQGLDRAPTIVFAMELYRNFDHFIGASLENAAQGIQSAYKTLRASRSPEALQAVDNFKTAIHLAFMLKAIDLVAKARNELNTHCDDYPDGAARKIILSQCLTNINAANDVTKQLALINDALQNYILKIHESFSFIETGSIFGRSPTKSIELLTALRDSLEAREAIQTQLNALIAPSQSRSRNIMDNI